jgi:hypothetical protein
VRGVMEGVLLSMQGIRVAPEVFLALNNVVISGEFPNVDGETHTLLIIPSQPRLELRFLVGQTDPNLQFITRMLFTVLPPLPGLRSIIGCIREHMVVIIS